MNAPAPLRVREPKPGLRSGLSAAFSGLRLTVSRGPVRSFYARLVLVVSVVAIAFEVAGIWAVFEVWNPSEATNTYAGIGLILLDVVGVILVLLSAPLLAVFIVSIALPVLAERVFLAAVATRRPDLAERLRAGEGLSFAEGATGNLRRMFRLLLGTGVAFAAGFIPIVGVVVGPALQLWFTSRALAWELLDPWFDLQRIPYATQREFVRKHSGMCVGFGLPYAVLLAVPIVGPMAFGIAQSGAGLLVADALTPPE